MLNLVEARCNTFALIADVAAHMAHAGRPLHGEAYIAFRDAVFWGGNVVTTIEQTVGEEVFMALRKPVDQMTKAELEQAWDFVHGDDKEFVSIVHARSAVQALVDRGELMTSEKYDELHKQEPRPKPTVKFDPTNQRWPIIVNVDTGKITVPEGHFEYVKPNVAMSAPLVDAPLEGELAKHDFRKGPAPKADKPKPVEKPVFTKPASGVIEILSTEDVGAGDQIGQIMQEQDTLALMDKVVSDNQLDPTPYAVYPNLGVRKMRITNKIRSLVRNGHEIRVAGIAIRLVAGALEEAQLRKKKR